jgi:hypothetical protein
VGNGLGLTNDQVYPYDGQGQATDFPAAEEPTVEQVIGTHVAMRDKTDEEYAAEFQDPNTAPARKQEIRDITAGLIPRETVPVEGPIPVHAPGPDLLAPIQSASSLEELRTALVAYLKAVV